MFTNSDLLKMIHLLNKKKKKNIHLLKKKKKKNFGPFLLRLAECICSRPYAKVYRIVWVKTHLLILIVFPNLSKLTSIDFQRLYTFISLNFFHYLNCNKIKPQKKNSNFHLRCEEFSDVIVQLVANWRTFFVLPATFLRKPQRTISKYVKRKFELQIKYIGDSCCKPDSCDSMGIFLLDRRMQPNAMILPWHTVAH